MLLRSIISNVRNTLLGESEEKDIPPNCIDGNWDNFWLKEKLDQDNHTDETQRQLANYFVPPSPNSGYNSVYHSPVHAKHEVLLTGYDPDQDSSQRLLPLPAENNNITAHWSSLLITPNSQLSSVAESSPAQCSSPSDVAEVFQIESGETRDVETQRDLGERPVPTTRSDIGGKRSCAHFLEIMQGPNAFCSPTNDGTSATCQSMRESKQTSRKRPCTQTTQASSRRIRATSSASASSPRDAAVALENLGDLENKGTRGLRHFSKRVCDKVQEKGVTTYNEVADELALEFSCQMVENGVPFSQKNIRRRVYDALNVLMAIGVIKKEKKQIEWLGLPSEKANHFAKVAAGKSLQSLMEENRVLQETIAESKIQLEQKLAKQVHLKNLIYRNAQRELAMKSGEEHTPDWKKLPLPFVLINSDSGTGMKIETMDDRREYLINMTNKFAMNEDMEILRQVGMNRASAEQIAEWVAPEHLPYLKLEKNGLFTRGDNTLQKLGRGICLSTATPESTDPANAPNAAAWIETEGPSYSSADFLEPPLFLREGFKESYNYVNTSLPEKPIHKRTATMERSISPTLLYLRGYSSSRNDVPVTKVSPSHAENVNQEYTPPNTPPNHTNTISKRIILPMKKGRVNIQSRPRV